MLAVAFLGQIRPGVAEDDPVSIHFAKEPNHAEVIAYHLVSSPGGPLDYKISTTDLKALQGKGCVASASSEVADTPAFAKFGKPSPDTELGLGVYRWDPLAQVPMLPPTECPRAPEKEGPAFSIVSLKTVRLGQDPGAKELAQKLGQTFLKNPISREQFLISSADVRSLDRYQHYVRWIQPLWAALKFDPDLDPERDELLVFFQPAQDIEDIRIKLGQIAQLLSDVTDCDPVDDCKADQVKVKVANKTALLKVAQLPEVVRIERVGEAKLRNSTTSWVIQTDQRGNYGLFDQGLTGQNQAIGFIDDGLDPHHCFFATNHFFRTGRFRFEYNAGDSKKKILAYNGEPVRHEGSPDFHGTYVAGILAGEDPADLNGGDRGQAPDASLVFTALYSFARRGPIPGVLYHILQQQHQQRALIFSNSWGDDSACSDQHGHFDESFCKYTGWTHDIDRFVFSHPEDLVVVAVSNSSRVTTLENARNALAVGASAQAGQENTIGIGGSGPTADGRLKPEIFVPGCRIRSAEAGTSCEVRMANTLENPGSCATSWAAPAVAGAAALVREYFVNGKFHFKDREISCEPSGALLKAMLLNASLDMPFDVKIGEDRTSEKRNLYPSCQEGWGRLELDRSVTFPDGPRHFDPKHRRTAVLDYHRLPPLLRSLQQNQIATFKVTAKSDLRVTLVWDDPPSAPGIQSPVVNDLDLIVQDSSYYFCGNDFDPATLMSRRRNDCAIYLDGADLKKYPDPLNNVEQVQVNFDDASREFTIMIRASSVLKGRASIPSQDFAVVVSGNDLRVQAQVQPSPVPSGTRLPVCSSVKASVKDVLGWTLNEFHPPAQDVAAAARAQCIAAPPGPPPAMPTSSGPKEKHLEARAGARRP